MDEKVNSMNLKICFITSGIKFSGNSLDKGSLGGSETSILCLSRSLVKLGHEVAVFNNCSEEGTFDGVHYFSNDRYRDYADSNPFDVTIASRWSEYLVYTAPTGLRVLWMHDMPQDKNLLMGTIYQTDLMIAGTEFHRDSYLEELPELKDFFWIGKIGVDLDLIDRNIRPKVPNKLIYTSRPERGLHYLLKTILPILLTRNPDIKLHIATYDVPKELNLPEASIIEGECRRVASSYPDNVVWMGGLKKDELYQEISSSELLVYPTNFPETFCAVAIEAQACRTPIITTDRFALRETVGDHSGVRIDTHPDDPEYARIFAEEVFRLLENKSLLKDMSEDGPEFVKESGFTWDRIAQEWVYKFHDMMRRRWSRNKKKVIQTLIKNSDLWPALDIVTNEQLQDEGLIDLDALHEVMRKANDRLPQKGRRERFNASIERYKTALKLMSTRTKPKMVLDVACGDTPFGFAAAKILPKCEIHLLDADASTCETIHQDAQKSNLEVYVYKEKFLEFDPTWKYDCIFIGNYLETTTSMYQVLEHAMELLQDDGVLVFTVRSGCENKKLMPVGKNDRIVDLGLSDFEQMLGDKFSATFVKDEKIGDNTIGYWAVATEKVHSIKRVNHERRKLITRPYQSLAFTMIVKDEEENITKCLNKISPICDSIVVVDTGSQDHTKEIAIRFGAKVISTEFDNFSHARNLALDNVSDDWVLWLDADEVLVGADNVRKYLQSSVYDAFTIKQNHLTLDMKMTCDTPIRLFRNLKKYRFTGYIHEHIEDLSKGKFDEGIQPASLIPDVDIAHYGYLNEKHRRFKCSIRNLNLLYRDMKENPERRMNKLLVIRDYINIVKWRTGMNLHHIDIGSEEHVLISNAVITYLSHFTDEDDKYHKLAFVMYQEALHILGLARLPVLGFQYPPIEINILLHGAVSGISEEKFLPQRIWFVDKDQLLEYMNRSSKLLVEKLGVSHDERPDIRLTGQEEELLRLGFDVYKDGDY